MLGLEDNTIWTAYVLSVAAAVLCLLYGIIFWNREDKEAREQPETTPEPATPAEAESGASAAPEEAVSPEQAPTEPEVEEIRDSAQPTAAEVVEPEQPAVEAIQPKPEPEPTPEREPEPELTREGLLARLKNRLSKTKSGMIERVRQTLSMGKVDDDMLEDIETILIQADVGVETTMKIVDRMRKHSEAKQAESPDELIAIFKQTLSEIVSHDERTLQLADTKPTIMLVIGVNGVGKTTTIGKLAEQYRKQGKKVMLVAGDTFRAAAVEQLTIWAERTDSAIEKQEMGSDPASVVYDALSKAESRDYDVVLIDTAGRLHTKSNLMEELKKINRVIQKLIPGAPHETLLILDATTGQNALSQAQTFSKEVNATGFIMTKLDGTAKGGILVALRDLFDIPVLKIGIGEGHEDLRDFDPQLYIDALFGE